MENIIGKHFFRNNVFNILLLIVIILQSIPFGLFIMMGSPQAIIFLIMIILFIVLFSKRKNPILIFNGDHFLYQAAALGSPKKIEYNNIVSMKRTKGACKVITTVPKKSITIALGNFNKEDRDSVITVLETVLKKYKNSSSGI